MKLGRGVAVEIDNCVYQSCPLNSLPEAFFFAQNLSSMCVARVLDPQPGERVLDMCASPGGKTTHAAQLMQNCGELVAFDKTQRKADEIARLCASLGITIVKAQKMNSITILKKKVCEPESFDRIILDAPCSGLGLRPNFGYNNWGLSALQEIASLQRRLLKEAVHLLKKGGVLVYSTCSFNPMENEGM